MCVNKSFYVQLIPLYTHKNYIGMHIGRERVGEEREEGRRKGEDEGERERE